MAEDRFEFLEQTFGECAPLFRDTTLPNDILNRYKVGLFLREPTFCDASYKLGGFVAPHRFLIISSNARCLDSIAPNPWGLCVWQRGRIFKIIDFIKKAACTQITLLEIPENLIDFFCNIGLNDLEQSFVIQSRETFEQCAKMPPLPELNTDRWRERLIYPIGVNDHGGYFPLFSQETFQSNEMAPLIHNVLHHQAKIHLSGSDYDEALPLLHKALDISHKFNVDKKATGSILLTLADLYFEISDLQKAETTLLEAFQAFKKIPDEKNRLAIAATHSRLGHVYQMRGAYLDAEQNYLHALKIRRRVGDSQSTVGLLASLGSLYEGMKRFDEAQSSLDEAFELSCDDRGECHDVVVLNNIARLAYKRGKYAKATIYMRRALLLERDKQPADLKQQARLLYNLAESLAASEEYEEAFESFREALEIDRYLIEEVITIASERQRQAFLTDSQFRIHQCISLILNFLSESQKALELVIKLIFERKSLALDLNARHRNFLLNQMDSEKASKLNELRELRARIAFETLAGTALREHDDVRSNFEEDIERCEMLESELARDIPSVDVERRLRVSGWRDIIELMPEKTVLLEFFRLKFYDFTSTQTGERESQITHKYLAVVLSKDKRWPEIVNLGDAKEIDVLIAKLRFEITGESDSDIRKVGSGQVDSSRKLCVEDSCGKTTADESGEQLRRRIFDPIVDHIGQSTRIILSPDGNLFRLPFEVLPLANGTRLIDQYEISYLTSGNDLLRLSTKSHVNLSQPLVIADPDFNLTSSTVTDGKAKASFAPFSRLSGTKTEGETIAQMLGVKMFSGAEAVEGVIKSNSSPAILHLATHGFVLKYQSQYLSPKDIEVGMTVTSDNPILAIKTPEEFVGHSTSDDKETESFIAVSPPRMVESNSEKGFSRLSGKGLNNPMLRSGIALAGANSWLQGQQLPDESEDGILTAEEVSNLNLTGTELVVLSACETGLGEILTGEGVFGFRRSFVLAGARSLVISLWKVPDVQTKELMIEFYARLIRGEARSEALRNAQLMVKKKYPDPFYWGAFICQGDFSPIADTFIQFKGENTAFIPKLSAYKCIEKWLKALLRNALNICTN